MTTLAVGAVTQRRPQVASYSLSATIVQPVVTVQEAVPTPSPAPTPPVYVTVNGVATSLDNPGMLPYPARALFIQNQSEAIKSAAKNTAIAYGLDPISSGDQAVRVCNQTFQIDLNNLPSRESTITQVILPP